MDALVGVTPVLDLDYGYDLAGNITDIDDIGGGSRGRNYAYDPLHRLTQGQELTPGATTVALQTDYTYDAVGNRTTRNVGGAAETYSYDPASNRLASVLAGGVTRAFTYSATGNVTLDDRGGTAMVLTYNAADRLVRVSAGAVTLVEYVYSATGQRASKTTTSNTTHYLYDPGGALYAETDGAGTVLREYITLGGATIAIIDAGGMSFVHNDHLATPQVMTDGAAAVVWDASYRPFGEATIAGAVANEQRFPGQTADAETGYSDNWHRTYDPSLGRYLQSDPIGLMAGFNTYGYAGGNPVMFADPTGQFLVSGAIFVMGSAGVALRVAMFVVMVYDIYLISHDVYRRYQAGCETLITRWEIFEIVTMGRIKWIKYLWRPFKRGGKFPGFNSGGNGGKPFAPTRAGGGGGPGGGGGGGNPDFPLVKSGDPVLNNAQNIKSESGYSDVLVHGTADGQGFVYGSSGISHRDVAKSIQNSGQSGDVRLISCYAGKCDNGAAQNLANKLGVNVKAPDDVAFIHHDGTITIGPDAYSPTGSWQVFKPN